MPDRDTPERMAAQRKLHDPRTDWRFATTNGGAPLQGLLDDFDQPVAKLRYEDGTWTGLYRHVLKVFLLDPQHRVRAKARAPPFSTTSFGPWAHSPSQPRLGC